MHDMERWQRYVRAPWALQFVYACCIDIRQNKASEMEGQRFWAREQIVEGMQRSALA